MASMFWVSEGVLLKDYQQHGKTVTGVYYDYTKLTRKLCEAIKQKRQDLHTFERFTLWTDF